MKNRKTVVVAFLLVAAMLLGVGYAALSDTLTISGTATVSTDNAQTAFDADIYFSEVSEVTVTSSITNPGTATAVIDSTDNDKGTINIPTGVLASAGDKIVVTYTIKSDSDLDVTVSAPSISNDNTNYFSVATDWTAAKTLTSSANTATVTVTVSLIKTPADDEVSTEFELTFNASTDSAPTTN